MISDRAILSINRLTYPTRESAKQIQYGAGRGPTGAPRQVEKMARWSTIKLALSLPATMAALSLPLLLATVAPSDTMLSGQSGQAATGTRNHLDGQISPYLQEHADNPVDWYPWGPEALARAKRENKPILLSIGYSACHWCHVMEKESFTDPATAALMNANFINIKVDREERPDLDDIYLKSVEIMTGRAGWPLTVFLTPDLKPFYGGTYFPKEDRFGLQSFHKVLSAAATYWRSSKDDLEKSATEITAAIETSHAGMPQAAPITQAQLEAALDALIQRGDSKEGGFNEKRKYPWPCALDLLLRASGSSAPVRAPLRKDALALLTVSLNHMAWGGLHDQVGGGFHRYTTDPHWRTPHFEKMLSDNALLARLYAQAALLTGNQYWRQIAIESISFLSSELKSQDGYCSSLDADSGGSEGQYYLWTQSDMKAALGGTDGPWMSSVLTITPAGTFENGPGSVARFSDSPEATAKKLGVTTAQLKQRLSTLMPKLKTARARRQRPHRDSKCLTGGNALVVSALVSAYQLTGNSSYLDEAKRTAKIILARRSATGVLPRLLNSGSKGPAGSLERSPEGFLDDYAYTVQALLDLASVDGDPQWLKTAITLTEDTQKRFGDGEKKIGKLYLTARDQEQLITRPTNFLDGAIPSGTAITAMNLLRLAEATGNDSYRKTAALLLPGQADKFVEMPMSLAGTLSAITFDLASPVSVVIAVDPGSPLTPPALKAVSNFYLPNAVSLVKDVKAKFGKEPALLTSKALKQDKPTIYLCRDTICWPPINDLGAAVKALRQINTINKN